MSSIRPLATITLLAIVGVFLYMKINETEPPLPEGVEDWSASTDIEFDMGGADSMASPPGVMSPTESTAPTFSVAPAAGDSAPAFDASASTAPTWSGPPTDSAPPAAIAAADTSVGEPVLPDLPPMPTLPPAPSTAPSVDVATETAPPSLPTAQTASAPPALTQSAESLSTNTQPTLPPGTAAPYATETPSLTAPATGSENGPVTPPANNAQAQASLFSATRLAVQAALDRGELSQALLLLSDWYGDPSLSPSETQEVNTLLGQLAGSVIYSTEHRLEPPYMVQTGERLETIAKEYNVPWQLLAKINGITSADQLQPGQKLKVVRGPFSALIDMSQRKMTLMLDRRYAGQFSLNLDPSVTVEAGSWEVNQKLLTPANVSYPGVGPTTPTEERSLMLSSAGGSASQVAILRGAMTNNPLSEPTGRVLRLNPNDAAEVFDILSLGSKVVIRR